MKHDVMRTLAEARPDELAPGAPDAATRENELTRAMASSRQAPRRQRRVRPAWGLALVGAGAAAALVATTLHDPGTTTPGPGVVAQPPVTARAILLSAAEKAEVEPTASGTYWHNQTLQRFYYRTGGYTIVTEERADEYAPTRPGLKMWGKQHYLGARPATAADFEAWKKAGSPSTFKVAIPGKGNHAAEFTAAPKKPTIDSTDLVDGNKIYWLGRNVTFKDLSGLPADPARLKASLLRWYKGHGTESTGDRVSSDQWLFDVTAGLITGMPVTPKVRAAAFRMLADLKTIEASGPVTDSLGRKGAAVMALQKTPRGVFQQRLIIDSSGRALARDSMLAGVSQGSTTIVKTDWTDHPPR